MTTPEPFTFDAGRAPTREQWIPFRLTGVRPDGTRWEDTFWALPTAPAWAFQHLINAPKVDQGTGAVGYFAPDVIAYIAAVLGDDGERSRFQRLLGDPLRHVEMGTLVKVMQWLSEHHGGFPTGAPSASAGGASGTGNGSGGVPSPQASPTPAGWPTTTGGGYGPTSESEHMRMPHLPPGGRSRG